MMWSNPTGGAYPSQIGGLNKWDGDWGVIEKGMDKLGRINHLY